MFINEITSVATGTVLRSFSLSIVRKCECFALCVVVFLQSDLTTSLGDERWDGLWKVGCAQGEGPVALKSTLSLCFLSLSAPACP